MKSTLSSLILLISFLSFAKAQEFTMPVLSPSAKVVQQFSTSSISIEYSRPSVRNRVIFGDLVPFGKAWRTGANSATKINFGEDVNFGGQNIEAGTYSLHTIPNPTEWTVILSKDLETTNAANYKEEDNIAKINIKATNTKDKIETFTISINDITTISATIQLAWENTIISIPVIADNKAKIFAYLEKELKKTNPIYQKAANFYLEENYKLDDALTYINKAIEGNPNAYWLFWTKAQILAKLNKKTEAIQAGEITLEKAKLAGSGDEYQKKLDELKKSFK
ncbi:MAG TPA: DUF2911 domain-containing protein [Chitinophagales bacterium]|nr:DUF2911 domain-containing protein [Chitinophagales bacterium]